MRGDTAAAELGEDWGTAELAAALYTVSTDVTRIKPLLPELSPADRSGVPNNMVLAHIVNFFAGYWRAVQRDTGKRSRPQTGAAISARNHASG